MTDGLSQLAQRGRRTREIPPPRNPARAARVQLASVPEPTATPPTPSEMPADVVARRPGVGDRAGRCHPALVHIAASTEG